MSAPNLKDMSIVTGRSYAVSLTGINNILLLSNSSNSNRLLKTSILIISNTDSATPADINLYYHSQASGLGTANDLFRNITVDNKTSITLLDKNESIYIEEDRSLTLVASTGNILKAFVSYEEIT
jgi:hypothetical protein